MKRIIKPIILFISICAMLTACSGIDTITAEPTRADSVASAPSFELDSVPEFNGEPYVVINDNIPYFSTDDYTTESYESYGSLDYLGRCTACIACVGTDTMPTAERGSIGKINPTGWQTAKYDNVDGKYLYNRCHLIGYQLTAENANPQNLITGTRYLNVDGMLPFENEVADYIEQSGNHVLYRVTPIFEGKNLVANGVEMEAYSIEDNGVGVQFNVYCYNSQPGISIDYATGESTAVSMSDNFDDGSEKGTYIVNISSKKFHKPSCVYADDIKEENKKAYIGLRSNLINNGYKPCKSCNP